MVTAFRIPLDIASENTHTVQLDAQPIPIVDLKGELIPSQSYANDHAFVNEYKNYLTASKVFFDESTVARTVRHPNQQARNNLVTFHKFRQQLLRAQRACIVEWIPGTAYVCSG